MDAKSVLIVDDNPQNLKLARVLLSHRGFQVQTAVDAEDALRVIATSPPRLILMDLQLPGMDGFDLTRKLKADPLTRHIIIVALTAYAMKGDAARALDAGCDAYVSKPIDTRSLPGLLEGYLARVPASVKN